MKTVRNPYVLDGFMHQMAGAAPVDRPRLSLPFRPEDFSDGDVLQPHVRDDHGRGFALYARDQGGPGEDPLVHVLQDGEPQLLPVLAQRLGDSLHPVCMYVSARTTCMHDGCQFFVTPHGFC